MADKPRLRAWNIAGKRNAPSIDQSTMTARRAIDALIDRASGMVRCHHLLEAHHTLVQGLAFRFIEKTTHGVLAGGFQLFYIRDNVLVRIKTRGTDMRPRPHMTISLTSGGLAWDEERAKFTRGGELRPKVLHDDAEPQPAGVLPLYAQLTDEERDHWADRSHFNFPEDFDEAGAAELQPNY